MMAEIAPRLLAWFEQHGRKDLPWQVADPYCIWVSEIMLQQTQVRTVIPYYTRFVARFPDVETLARATVDEVLHHWSGLGYYARARNLHAAAQRLCEEFSGQFPKTLDAIQSLPGVGRSTAGAILALAFDQRQPILDGNVKRVLARFDAIDGWPGNTAVAARLWVCAEHYTPAAQVAAYTQAMMDLGATVCTRSRPRCLDCPLHTDCRAFLSDSIASYPGARPKKPKPLKSTTMVLAVANESVLLRRRPASGIWGGLWSLPELDDEVPAAWCERVLGMPVANTATLDILRHSFSHYDLDIQPLVLSLAYVPGWVADQDDTVWYRLDDTPPGGIAAPVRKLLDTLKDSRHVANG